MRDTTGKGSQASAPRQGCQNSATPTGVVILFDGLPVVATTSWSYHRLICFHPFGMIVEMPSHTGGYSFTYYALKGFASGKIE